MNDQQDKSQNVNEGVPAITPSSSSGLATLGRSEDGTDQALRPTNAPAHSPLPWVAGWGGGRTGPTTAKTRPCVDNEWTYDIISEGPDNTLAILPDHPRSDDDRLPDHGTATANAEFIVRACNSHYATLQALRIAEEELAFDREHACVTKTGEPRAVDHALDIVRAAIAKAEGK